MRRGSSFASDRPRPRMPVPASMTTRLPSPAAPPCRRCSPRTGRSPAPVRPASRDSPTPWLSRRARLLLVPVCGALEGPRRPGRRRVRTGPGRPGSPRPGPPVRPPARPLPGVSEHAGRDRGEGHAPGADLVRHPEGLDVAGRQQGRGSLVARGHGPDGVDHPAGGELPGGGRDGLTRGKPVRLPVVRRRRHSARISGPPRRWMAPSTPPPPSSDEFAALTIASTSCS